MDAAMLGTLATIVVGIAAAGGALIGKRGENRAAQGTAVLSGYDSLVNNLQEERNALQTKLADAERRLADAYSDLSTERADKATLQTQIHALTIEAERLRRRIAELEGHPS